MGAPETGNEAGIADREEIERSIEALEAQRALLGDAIEPALAALRAQLGAMSADEDATEDQRKQITVLFADVKGFTDMSQQMDPEDVAEVMNSLWSRVDQVIVDSGGRVDKHIGDAVMALFGAPRAREDDPERAVRAALEMQALIETFGAEYGEATSSLQMRVGINTGLAMLGTIGSTGEYTAIGHAVNLASRLEGLADPGGILMSQSTMNEVVGLFDIESTEPLEVKGVDHAVTAYRVKRAKPRTFRVGPREVAGIQTRLVGREDEISLLESILPSDPNHPPNTTKLVTLLGEPGVGKSRIVYEYFNFLEGLPHSTWLFRGRAVQSSKDTPYAVLRSILRDRFLIADSDSTEEAKEKLEGGLAAHLDDGLSLAPFLGHLIGLDYRLDPGISGLLDDSKIIRERAFKGFANLLALGAVGSYRVLLIEDIHWSDPESLELLEYLAEQLAECPALILCTARPSIAQVMPDWLEESSERTVIRLERLGDEATSQLIEDVLQLMEDPPLALRELIASRSDGNPFYLEELVKMLIDKGVIDATSIPWTVRPEALDSSQVPGTLTGVLQARLDALPREERRVLQKSSVVGRVFWEDAVDHLARATAPDEGDVDLASLAKSLAQLELAYERTPSAFEFTREFIFKHAMLHDVAYESVVRRDRRTYHHEVAAWLIGAAGSRREEFAGQIAEHYDRAEDISEAVTWLLSAGDRARETHAPDTAERAYRRAMDLSSRSTADSVTGARFSAMAGLGEVLTMQARYGDAIGVYGELCALATDIDDWGAVARAEHGIATAETHRGKLKEALESAGRARRSAERAGDRKREAQAMFIEAWSFIRLGSFEKGAGVAGDMLSVAREVDEPGLLAEALNLQGVISASTGKYEKAVENFSEAADFYEAAGNAERLMPILNNLGVIAELRGNYAAAETRYRDALARALEASDKDAELVYSSNLGGALVAQGRPEESVSVLRHVIDGAPGESSLLSEANRFLAEALLDLGRTEESIDAAVAALDHALVSEAHDDIAGAWRILGVISSRTSRPIEFNLRGATEVYQPDDLFARSLEMASSVESESDIAKALAAWAVHDAGKGALEASEARWSTAKFKLLELGAESEVERIETLMTSLRAQSVDGL